MKNIENEDLHKLMELPWIKTFILLMRKSSVANLFQENKDAFTSFLQKNYLLVTDYTLLDAFRLDNIIRLLSSTASIEGDIIECGCYKGGTGLLMGLWLKENNIKKKIYLFDSFEGLPEPDSQMDKGYTKGQFTANLDALVQKIAELDLQEFVYPVKGWFKDSIPPFLREGDKKCSLLHVDCDLYESTRDCLPALFPVVTPNGVVIFDDFNDGARGEKKAVLETLIEPYTVQIGPAAQSYLLKTITSTGVKDGPVYYSFSDLVQNKAYIDWVDKKAGINYHDLLSSYFKDEKITGKKV